MSLSGPQRWQAWWEREDSVMARKSRKTETLKTPNVANVLAYKAAIYVRLSVEDTHSGSVSIETQQLIIQRFLDRNPDISVYKTYIDNGCSGTTFNRESFQQMISDIDAGLVNCVIVKDLSRLGRNVIDTGYYIEQYFRTRNIRFIAVNENYDTLLPEDSFTGLTIPLRNLVSEAYALDIGKKIRASERQFMKDGKFIGPRSPYGYLKSPDDCHQLVIDPVAAAVVKQIFHWAADGVAISAIVRRLNDAGTLPPSHHKRAVGENSSEKLLGHEYWQGWTVRKILHSEVYTGKLVQGRTKIVNHVRLNTSPDEYYIVQNTHEAIISQELYDAVQFVLGNMAKKSKNQATYTPYILKGRIRCASCGCSLNRRRTKRKRGPDRYALCCPSKSAKRDLCPGVHIYEDALLQGLTDILLETLNVALGQFQMALLPPEQLTAREKALHDAIEAQKRESTRIQGLIRSLYENFSLDLLTKEEYYSYKEKYTSQLEEAEGELTRLEGELQALKSQGTEYENLKSDAESIRKDHVLTAELVERLIDKVEVWPDKHYTVHFAFTMDDAEGKVEKCRRM